MAKILGLRSSIDGGKAPLLVGFVVDGPTVADKKMWRVRGATGYVVDERNDNLVHEYLFENPGEYDVWVDIVDVIGNVREDGSKHANHIVVEKKNEQITTFAQRQAVILKDEHVGFAMSYTNNPFKLVWKWGDGKPDNVGTWPDVEENPDHKYTKPGRWKGSLDYYVKHNKYESKEFGVLVLDSPTKLGVDFDVRFTRNGYDPTEMPFPPKKKLTFTVHAWGGQRPYIYAWNFGDETPVESQRGPNRDTDHQFHKEYRKPDNYTAKLTITDDWGYQVVASQTIIIR